MKRIFLILLLLAFFPSLISAFEKEDLLRRQNFARISNFKLTPNPVGLGDNVTLVIEIDSEASDDIVFPLNYLPDWAVVRKGPISRTYSSFSEENVNLYRNKISVTLKFTKTSRLIFPAIPFTVGGITLKTKPFLVRVGVYKNRKLVIPIDLVWQTGHDPYIGEALPVYLVLKDQEAIGTFDDITVGLPSKGFFENAGDVGSITSKTIDDIVLFDIPAAAFILTPTSADRIKIPAAGVSYNGIKGWSDDKEILVKDIPSEIKESGAIGSFKITSSINKKELSLGEEIVLTYKITGNGNLNYLKTPEPEVSNFFIVSSKTDDNFHPDISGFSGTKTIYKTYKPKSSGTGRITIPDFYFLDTISKTVVRLDKIIYNITVKNSSTSDSHESSPKTVFKEMKLPKYQWRNHYKSFPSYVWLLPGFLFFILIRFFKKINLIITASLTVIIPIILFSILFFLLPQTQIKQTDKDSNDFYNKAELAYEQDNLPESLHYLRAAIYLNPLHKGYREILNTVEFENNLENSVEPSKYINPDIFYFILVAFFNLSFFAIGYNHLTKKRIFQISIFLFIFLSVISLSMIFYLGVSATKINAVIAEENAFIKKVPKESAGDWILLKKATSVRILDSSNSYCFIKTSEGITGWIESEYLLPDYPF